jgi:16S rRNA (guanine527-N7)-methyltransferase
VTDDGSSVSRETPPAPVSARGAFADRLPLAERYAGLLATDGVLRGLIGPREAPRLWDRHLVNCAVLERLIPADASVCDIGTGAGLPGLVLAIVRPDLRITLVEPLLRRTTFLDEAVAALGVERVEVVRARAEELHGRTEFDVVTSRAVAPLGRLLDWSMPLVRKGGSLLAMKGASAADEVRQARERLAAHGAGTVEVLSVGVDLIDPPTTVLRVESTRPSRLRLDAVERGPEPQARGHQAGGRGARKNAPRSGSSARSSRRKGRRP